MRSKGPRYYGVLTPNELEQIFRECRSGDCRNAEWLWKYFDQEWVEEPEAHGTTWAELLEWCNATATPSADDAD